MSLTTKTNKWVENKLISAEQAQAILAFERWPLLSQLY